MIAIASTRAAVRTLPRAAARILFATALCAALVTLAGVARAEEADKQKPISWSSEEPFEGNLAERSGTLRKNVIITQGTTVIHADRVEFKQNPDNSMSAVAFGNPVAYRTKRDNAEDYNQAFAQKIVYDGQTGTIELNGNALLKQGEGDEMRSNYMRYDMRNEKFIGEARPDAPGVTDGPGNRVRGVFLPRETPGAPGATGKAAAPVKDAKDAKGASATPKPAATDAPAKAPVTDPAKAAAPAPANSVPLKSDTELKNPQ